MKINKIFFPTNDDRTTNVLHSLRKNNVESYDSFLPFFKDPSYSGQFYEQSETKEFSYK